MATLDIKGFEDVYKALEKCSNPQGIQLKALESAAPYLVKAVQKTINETEGGGNKLARSFSATKARSSGVGAYVSVRPVGKDKNGYDWATRAASLEYGTVWPRKEKDAAKIHHLAQAGQPKNPAHQWRDRALNAARTKCEETMRQSVFSEIDKVWT